MADTASLISQMQNAGWGGEWNSGGVDRYSELAQLFLANGIDDISKLSLDTVTPDQATVDQYDANMEQYAGDDRSLFRSAFANSGLDMGGQRLMYDGRPIGFLGDVNNDGSLSKIGVQPYLQRGGLGGWSSTGDGHNNFYFSNDPNGKLQVNSNWGSSSDAYIARDLATIATIGLGGYYGGTAAAGSGGLGGGISPTLAQIGANAASYGMTNAAMTGLQGGDFSDATRAFGQGAISGGLGTYVGGVTDSPFLGSATRAGTSTALAGGDLSDVARAGLVGGLGSQMPNVAGSVGIDDPYLQSAVNGGLRGAATTALQGGDWRVGATQGALPGAVSYSADALFGGMPDVGTIGGNMYDEDGESSATLGGSFTPVQNDANIQAMGVDPTLDLYSTPEKQPTSTGGGVTDFIGSVTNALGLNNITPGRFGDLASGLAQLYMGNKQRRMARDFRRQIAGNRGAYEEQLRRNLQRRDAASGRRSDYGGRETQLQASLAELDSRNMPAMAQLSQMETGGLMNMLNAGLVTGNRMGWFNGQPQTQMPSYSSQLPSLSSLGSQPQTYSLFDDQNKNKYKLGGM